MDVRCKHCGEPWSIDEFHEGEFGTFEQWSAAFLEHGCGAMDALYDGMEPSDSVRCIHSPIVDEETREAIEIMTDLADSHDMDGLASDIDCFMSGWMMTVANALEQVRKD